MLLSTEPALQTSRKTNVEGTWVRTLHGRDCTPIHIDIGQNRSDWLRQRSRLLGVSLESRQFYRRQISQ